MIELLICIGIAFLIMCICFVCAFIFSRLSESVYWDSIIKPFIVFLIILTGLVYLFRYAYKNVQIKAQNEEYKIEELLGE